MFVLWSRSIQVNFEALLIDAKYKLYGVKYQFKNHMEIFSHSVGLFDKCPLDLPCVELKKNMSVKEFWPTHIWAIGITRLTQT